MTKTSEPSNEEKRRGGSGKAKRNPTERDDVAASSTSDRERPAKKEPNGMAHEASKKPKHERISSRLSSLADDDLRGIIQDQALKAVEGVTQTSTNVSNVLRTNHTSPEDNAAAIYDIQRGVNEAPTEGPIHKVAPVMHAASANPSRLFDLPQELQDEILLWAYLREDGFEIIFQGDWEYNQEHIRNLGGPGPDLLKLFVPKVNAWLVSKRCTSRASKVHSQSPTEEVRLGFCRSAGLCRFTGSGHRPLTGVAHRLQVDSLRCHWATARGTSASHLRLFVDAMTLAEPETQKRPRNVAFGHANLLSLAANFLVQSIYVEALIVDRRWSFPPSSGYSASLSIASSG